MRWRQTSHAEGVHTERQLLDLLNNTYEAHDVKVGGWLASALPCCRGAQARLSRPPYNAGLALSGDAAGSNPSALPRPALPPAQVGPHREEFIHTVSAGGANTASPAFVAVPGYGSGSSFLFKLFDGLSSAFRFHAVDMLGTGLSGGWGPAWLSCHALLPGFPAWISVVCLSGALRGMRPAVPHSQRGSLPCPPSPAPAGRPAFRANTTQEAEQFFVTSLDAWREAQGLDKMVLMGHSMGGYLSGQSPWQQLLGSSLGGQVGE